MEAEAARVVAADTCRAASCPSVVLLIDANGFIVLRTVCRMFLLPAILPTYIPIDQGISAIRHHSDTIVGRAQRLAASSRRASQATALWSSRCSIARKARVLRKNAV